MFRNLEAEMSRNGIKKGDLAKALRMTATTLSNKLGGKAPFTLTEAFAIKAILGVNLPLEDLFKKTA